MGLRDMIWPKGPVDQPAMDNRAEERRKRLEQYRKTWEAYLAELPDPIIIDPKTPEVNDNVKVNPARAAINTSVYFLFGNCPKFEVSPELAKHFDNDVEHEDNDPDWLKALNRAWKANRKQSFLYNLGLSGAIHGTPFIKIIPNGAGMRNEYPGLVILDPANVDVECDPNDYNKVLKYCIDYVTEDETGKPKVNIQEISANQDIEGRILSWTIQDYEQETSWVHGAGWVPGMNPKVPTGPAREWEYSWPPIEHCQNMELPHQFWGLPDLDEASVEVIKSLQRSMSSLNKIVRIHASPRMYAKNVMPDQVADIDVSADNIITLPNMDAEMSVLQTLQNLSPSIQFTDKLREDLYEMLQVPPIALGKFETASTTISGVSISILYAPILQKTELKQLSYGDMLDRLNHKLLELMGYDDHENHMGLTVVWPENMPGSAYLKRQTLETDKQLGVSTYTTVEELGYDPVEEEIRTYREMEARLKLEAKYSNMGALTEGEETRGGNNNPSGFGHRMGSVKGGVESAGTPKAPAAPPPNQAY